MSRLLLRGWRIETALPAPPRTVILACPHTSNTDGLLLALLLRSAGSDASWMIKDTWTKPPMGWVLRPLGATPVDRGKPTGMVGQMVEQFEQREHFHLIVPPEGTRSRAEHWKSGFYRIALGAAVPVVPAYMDYRTKRAGFGAPVALTGDKRADMDQFREIYADAGPMARFPEKFGPVKLADEDE